MASSSATAHTTPICNCGGGRMVLCCAGKKAQHVGRFFYRCPFNQRHPQCFLWADDYHRQQDGGNVPDFVRNQKWQPSEGDPSVVSSTAYEAESINPPPQMRRLVTFDSIIALNGVAIIIFLLGVVIGKLS